MALDEMLKGNEEDEMIFERRFLFPNKYFYITIFDLSYICPGCLFLSFSNLHNDEYNHILLHGRCEVIICWWASYREWSAINVRPD